MSQPLFAICHCLNSWMRLTEKKLCIFLEHWKRGENWGQWFLEKNVLALKNVITHGKGKGFYPLLSLQILFQWCY